MDFDYRSRSYRPSLGLLFARMAIAAVFVYVGFELIRVALIFKH